MSPQAVEALHGPVVTDAQTPDRCVLCPQPPGCSGDRSRPPRCSVHPRGVGAKAEPPEHRIGLVYPWAVATDVRTSPAAAWRYVKANVDGTVPGSRAELSSSSRLTSYRTVAGHPGVGQETRHGSIEVGLLLEVREMARARDDHEDGQRQGGGEEPRGRQRHDLNVRREMGDLRLPYAPARGEPVDQNERPTGPRSLIVQATPSSAAIGMGWSASLRELDGDPSGSAGPDDDVRRPPTIPASCCGQAGDLDGLRYGERLAHDPPDLGLRLVDRRDRSDGEGSCLPEASPGRNATTGHDLASSEHATGVPSTPRPTSQRVSSLNIVGCLWAWSSSSWAALGTARRSARAGRSRRTTVMITSGFRSMFWNQLVRVPDAEQTMALSVGPSYRNTSRMVGAGGQSGDPGASARGTVARASRPD